jgi:hypothetical protein
MEKEKIELLKQIAKNTSPKESMQIIVTGNKSDFYKTFNPPLQLNNEKEFEVALIALHTYYSFPNIDVNNNKLYYYELKKIGYNPVKTITIPVGAHELESANQEIQNALLSNGDENAIIFTFNKNTMLTTMLIKQGYKVAFDYDDSIGILFGFLKREYKEGTYISENIINIISVNSILVHLNIINGSFVDGQREPVIYNFYPKVSPGYKINETPTCPIYLPVSIKTIKDLKITITDQNGKHLNLRDETITITLNIREV